MKIPSPDIRVLTPSIFRSLTNCETNIIDAALKVLAEELPINVRVSGNCMHPFFGDGAAVQFSSRRFYWPGDILVFRCQDGRLLVHRLLGCYFRNGAVRYLTKADVASCPDRAVTRQHIIGKLVGGCSVSGADTVSFFQRVLAMGNFVRFVIYRLVTIR